jgi:PAS domain S-box-containing protein
MPDRRLNGTIRVWSEVPDNPADAKPGAGPAELALREMIGGLRRTLRRTDLALSAVSEGIVWTDTEGDIQSCNSAFLRLAGQKSAHVLGKSLIEILPLRRGGRPLEASEHPARILLSPGGPGSIVQDQYRLQHAGSERVLEIHANRVDGHDGGLLLVIRDLTERVLAEAWLERESARLDLLHQVAVAANELPTPEEAVQLALQKLCTHTGWPVGHVYLTDLGLSPSGIWHIADAARFRRFRDSTESLALLPGQDLVGRVQLFGAPAWASDLSEAAGFLRAEAAQAGGLMTGFGFPILTGRQVIAVFEMYTTEQLEPDEGLLRLAGQIGTQLGRLFERRQLHEDLLTAKRGLELRVEERTSELRQLNQALLKEIKDREQAQTALGDVSARHRCLVHTVRDLIFSTSASGRLESLNPAFEALTGFRSSEWLGRRLLRLVHPEDRRFVWNQFIRLAAGENLPPFEVRILSGHRGWLHVECSIARYKSAEMTSLFGVARDVTERRQAEEQLLLRDRAMASTSEGIFITDALQQSNPLIYVNSGFERLTGHAAFAIPGRSWETLFGEGSAAKAVEELREAMESGTGCTAELRIYRSDASDFWGRISLTPVRDGSGHVTHFIGIVSDITQQKQAERMKNDLVATVSHELRTPLTSLRGFAELMLEREFEPEKRKKFLGIVHKEAVRLSELINDFLDLQRIESGRQTYQFGPVNLVQLVEETVALFRGGNLTHQLDIQRPGQLPEVLADADRIRQVLSNLVSNAVKFSPAGGLVRITMRQGDGVVEASISDQGIGIPAAAQEKLFQKFFRADNTETRKIGGTGLGLALVKQIIEAHSGRVWVQSVYGEGSTFSFTLPVAGSPTLPLAATDRRRSAD